MAGDVKALALIYGMGTREQRRALRQAWPLLSDALHALPRLCGKVTPSGLCTMTATKHPRKGGRTHAGECRADGQG